MQSVDSARMRAQNRALILKRIWRDRRTSRAALARECGMARSTLSAIVGDLMATGLVETLGAGSSRGGRRPILIGFDDDACGIVGVEMGAAHVGVALTNLRGQVQAWRSQPHPVRSEPQTTLDLIRQLVRSCLDEATTYADRLVGIGIAVPSPIDPSTRRQMSPRILPAWAGIDLVEALGDTFGGRVELDNDANLGALAEHWWGAHAPGDLAYVKVATGVGAGLLIDDRVYRGAGGIAGEIGHTAIDPSGPRCICGLDGCLVTLVGSEALVARVVETRDRRPESALASGPVDIQAITAAALADDALAVEVVGAAGHHLGIALASLLNLIDPATVVLGGDLTRVGDLLLAPLRDALKARSLFTSVSEAQVVTSQLGDQAIAVGAATMILRAALERPELFPLPTQHLEVAR